VWVPGRYGVMLVEFIADVGVSRFDDPDSCVSWKATGQNSFSDNNCS